MTPLDLEVTVSPVVRHPFLTRHIISVTDIQTTREMIPPDIFTLRPDGPSSFRIDIRRHLQIQVVIDSEVVSQIIKIQTPSVVVAIGRHDQTARVLLGDREEAERDSQG